MLQPIDIGAPEGGECKYEGFVLDNGMKVILISSEKFTSCGATLGIEIGHIHASPSVLGLLHLMEHVITRNMLKPDQENEFGVIIDQYGGDVVASTEYDYSNYYYKTQSISPSLELFAKHIFHPTFDSQSIAAEIENVDSEDTIDSTDDDKCLDEFYTAQWQFDQLDEQYGFGGNKYTLQTELKRFRIDIKEELEKFHEKYFSPHLMSLIVFARDDINSLKKIVTDIFAPKKNKNAYPCEFSTVEINEKCGIQLSIVPTQHDNLLKTLFLLPDICFDSVCTHLHYCTAMFEHEGYNSLLSSLKERNWCTAVTFHTDMINKRTIYYILTFNLTRLGLYYVEDIIRLVFEYVFILQNLVQRRQLDDEFREIKQSNDFLTAESVENSITEINSRIRLYPFENVLKTQYDVEFPVESMEAIMNVMQSTFVKTNIIVCVMAKDEETNAITPSQIKYKFGALSKDTVSRLSNVQYSDLNFITRRTDFIQKLMAPYEKLPHDEQDIKYDSQGWKTNNSEIRFYPAEGRSFEMYLQLSSKEAYRDAKRCNLNNMLAYVLRDSMSEKLYSAKKIGISCEIESNTFGIRVIIKNDEYKKELVDVLLREIMSVMKMNVRIADSRFKMLEEQYTTYLKNLSSAKPNERALYYLEFLLTKRMWTYEELLKKTVYLTSDKLKQYIKKFYNGKFMHCLIQGDMSYNEGCHVRNYLISDCRNSTESRCHRPDFAKDAILPSGRHYLYTTSTVFHKSSCTMVYYQIGKRLPIRNNRSICLNSLLLINAIISEHCHYELRAKAHLGYIAESHVIQINDTCGLAICVVGHIYETEYVEEQIDDFMKKMLLKIGRDISDDDLKKYKMKADNYKRHITLPFAKKLHDYYLPWEQILYSFFPDNAEPELNVTKICRYFEKMIHTRTERKLSVHIKSEINRPAAAQQSAISTIRRRMREITAIIRRDKPMKIENIALFKRALDLCPW